MAVKRYGVKDQSGSWHYIEDHTHLIGSPTWKLIEERGEYYIFGLLDARSGERTGYKDILDITHFIGKSIYSCQINLYEEYRKDFLELSPVAASYMNISRRTPPIRETIKFQ